MTFPVRPAARIALVVDYEVAGLPIEIAGKSTLHVLGLSPKLADSLYRSSNDSAEPGLWPASWSDSNAMELVYKCKVINRGDALLQDVTLPYKMIFWMGGSPSSSIASQVREMKIPALMPEAVFEFHLVNMSSLNVIVVLPRSGEALVTGEKNRRMLDCVPSHPGSIAIPEWPFHASRVEWDFLVHSD